MEKSRRPRAKKQSSWRNKPKLLWLRIAIPENLLTAIFKLPTTLVTEYQS
jgi:hypothetical protein